MQRVGEFSVWGFSRDGREGGITVNDNIKIVMLSIGLYLASFFIKFIAICAFGGSFGALCSWDCGWYMGIINEGYHLQSRVHELDQAANWAFFPLFPLMSKGVALLFGLTAGTALLLTGNVIYLLAIAAFIKFCLAFEPRINPLVCGLVLILNPYSIYAHTGYTEPLYLLLSCLSLICLRRGHPILAGIFGGALSAVRAVGIMLLFSYCIVNLKRFFTHREERLNIALGFMLIPLGLALFMTCLHYIMGDAMAFSHVQRAWGRIIQNPFQVVINSIGPQPIYIGYLLNLLVASLLIAKLFFDRRFELAVFALTCVLVPLSTGIWSLPRYIWWQAPILFAAAQVLQARWLAVLVFSMMLAGSLFMYHAWFTGEWFVI